MNRSIACLLLSLCWWIGVAPATAAASAATDTSNAAARVRLYVLDCGHIEFKDMGLFSDTGEYDGKAGALVDPCFVIRHPHGILVWDTGLGDGLLGRSDPPNPAGVSLRVRVRLIDQLAAIGIKPADVNFLAFSHFHLDHTGNANAFTAATWLVNRAELDWALATPTPPVVDPQTLSGRQTAHTQMLDGDYDVFHDGTVRILKTPGHTPGHQVLLVRLARSGPVMLSGDLYHLRTDRPSGAAKSGRVMSINTSRAESMASIDRVETLLKNTGARLIVQHDPDDYKTLPVSPAYLD